MPVNLPGKDEARPAPLYPRCKVWWQRHHAGVAALAGDAQPLPGDIAALDSRDLPAPKAAVRHELDHKGGALTRFRECVAYHVIGKRAGYASRYSRGRYVIEHAAAVDPLDRAHKCFQAGMY